MEWIRIEVRQLRLRQLVAVNHHEPIVAIAIGSNIAPKLAIIKLAIVTTDGLYDVLI